MQAEGDGLGLWGEPGHSHTHASSVHLPPWAGSGMLTTRSCVFPLPEEQPTDITRRSFIPLGKHLSKTTHTKTRHKTKQTILLPDPSTLEPAITRPPACVQMTAQHPPCPAPGEAGPPGFSR